jgi:hypothetical protein
MGRGVEIRGREEEVCMVGLDRKFVVEGYGKIQYILQSGMGKMSCRYLHKSMQGYR